MRQWPERCSVPGCKVRKADGLEKGRHHAARDRQTRRKLYAYAAAVGACRKCIGRKGTTPAEPGRTRCADCLARDRQAKRLKRAAA
jgi:hypothetical protein